MSSSSPPAKRVRRHSPSMSQPLPPVKDLLDTRALHACFYISRSPDWAGALDSSLRNTGFCEKIVGNIESPVLQALHSCADKRPNNGNEWQLLFEVLLEMHPSKQAQIERDQARNLEMEDAQKKATSKAWETKFIGSHHQRLFNKLQEIIRIGPDKSQALDTNNEPIWWYRNILPIVQSSGMGKSRTVDELAKLVFTIPICLRKENDSGFPAGDYQLLSLFTQNHTITSDIDAKSACISIFSAIFSAIAQELKRSPFQSPLEWHERLKSPHPSDPSAAKSVRTVIYDVAHALVRNASLTGKELDAATIEMKNSLESLVSFLPRPNGTGERSLRLVLYVDECQSLTSIKMQKDTTARKRTMLDFLLYAIDQCRDYDLAGVTLSTNSTMSDVSFPKDVLPSHREIGSQRNVRHPPFVQFGFDEWREKTIITESELTLFDVCKVEFLSRFGRLLWWTRITDPETNEIDDEQIKTLIPFAAAKLTRSEGELTERAQLAVLSVRLCLDLEPMRISSRHWEEELVSSHMRIVYNVPEHKEYMRSGYSSEPILAEAAAQIWSNDTRLGFQLFKPLSALTHLMETGMLSKGERGELVARFLLLRASDIALEKRRTIQNIEGHLLDDQARYSRPVPLWDFFEALFNPDQLARITNARARNRTGGKGLKAACKNKYVRFSHFARAGDSSVTSTAAAWKALARANAWQCYERQECIDIVVPVFCKEKDNFLLGRKAITFILIQVKNTKRSKTVHFSAESLGLFDDVTIGRRQVSYFVIVFNFGVSTTTKESGLSRPANPAMGSPAKLKMRGQPDRKRAEAEADPKRSGHPCYWFEVTGCSAMAFNSEIVSAGTKQLRSILATHSLEDEALDLETRDVIQRLKPNFVSGQASFGWAMDDLHDRRTPGTTDITEEAYDGILMVEDDEDGDDTGGGDDDDDSDNDDNDNDIF